MNENDSSVTSTNEWKEIRGENGQIKLRLNQFPKKNKKYYM